MMAWAQFNMLTPVQLTSSQWGDPCVFLALWMQESGFSCMSRAVSLWDLCQLREVTCGNFVSSSVAPNSACHEFVLANVVNTGPVVFARFQGVTLGGGVGVRRAVYGWGVVCVKALLFVEGC